MQWKLVLFTFLGLIIIRFILNLWKYYQTNSLFAKYKEYLKKESYSFAQHVPQIKSLFREAGLQDFGVPITQPAGFGLVKSYTLSGHDNITNNNPQIVGGITMAFYSAQGVFKQRMVESFNPLFWLDFVFKMPQHLLEYVGVLPEKVIVKILNVVYWIILALIGANKANLFDLGKLLK